MRFGIFSVVDHYPSELPRSTQQLYGELLDQAEAAEELGFQSFWIAEHHFHEYGAIPRPPVWISAAAQRTRRIRLGAAVAVLPFENPVRTAEDYAMVDILSGGRLEMGVGSGYLEHEFEGFGIDPGEKRQRFDESLEILLQAWAGDRFSYEGAYYQVKDIALNVVPIQKPRPPVSVAILRNEAAPFVGQKRLPIMMIPYATSEHISELAVTTRKFREAFSLAGGAAESATVHFGLHTHCAESTAKARADAEVAVNRYVRTRLYARQRTFGSLIEKDLVAIGDPDEIVRVARLYESAGLTDFLIIGNFGGLAHELVLRSMELIARHVLPEFQHPLSHVC